MVHLRIAHISDLHFSKVLKGPGQFFSKAWIGNLNLVFNRGYDFLPERPYALLNPFKQEKVTDIIVSGDLTTTASKSEYHLAKQFVSTLEEEGFRVYLVPGNHDHYTKRAYRSRRFYDYFHKEYSQDLPFNLREHGVTATKFSDRLWLVLMDTALATPLVSSNGSFSPSIEENLRQLLSELPSEDKVLLVNHFPFFQNDQPKRRLKRGTILEEILQNEPNIQLYLHGHTHRRCVADLRPNKLPIILDSGSTAYKCGSWNLIDLTENNCTLKVFGWNDTSWSEIENHEFRWKSE